MCKEGQIVFLLSANVAIDANNVLQVLSEINHPVTILVDGLAAHAPSIRTIMTQLAAKKPVVIISAERDYRCSHIERVIGDLNVNYEKVDDWDQNSYELLIEKLFRIGLLASYESVHFPKKFASDLINETVAIATCRALNNFKPLETILRSIWRDASADEKRSYAISALAEHCYEGGIFYPVLEKAHPNSNLRNQLKLACPLPLTYADDSDYIYPLHAVVADRLLMMLAREKSEWLLDIFSSLANALAPHVNRKTTISRTPEARLAARLFSSEKVVRPLLGKYADSFYEKSQPAWKWNPRYWEQRALLTQTSDIDLAIQYARHAVAIEEHPFPWTTLASLLVKKLDFIKSGHASIFAEVIDLLQLVIRHERAYKTWRPTPHPYTVLFHAVSIFMHFDGEISPKARQWLSQQTDYCRNTFSRDKTLMHEIDKILLRLK